MQLELNSLIFPAPKFAYNKSLPGLIFINKAFLPKKNQQPKFNSKITSMPMIQGKSSQDVQVPYFNRGRTNSIQSKQESYNIPCRLIQDCKSNQIMVYFHANAEDLGTSSQFLNLIQQDLKISILAVEYPGYGLYLGETTSKQIQKDSETVLDFLINNVGYNPKNIFIFGRSIGTGPATHISTLYQFGCLILMSPYTSVQAVANSYIGEFFGKFVLDRFRTIDIIDKVQCPIFITHGQLDTLIPFTQSQELYNKMNDKFRITLHIGKDMTHNYLDIQTDFLEPYKQFLNKFECPRSSGFLRLDSMLHSGRKESQPQLEIVAPQFPDECFNSFSSISHSKSSYFWLFE